ncbi:hypothetical protein HW450_08585 [Corynebacterium hindlerae]|uniref:DedA family protein n=1 Tax=Corynebacterium hindlerae TaxID=699041 RepID=A0A7G5FCT2_9CORY|nr:hypothetical protein [Corynebacterium hindlerae]QMV84423.1 hypothetical protein HW450_08585 [Corynebacterium hindlerae]
MTSTDKELPSFMQHPDKVDRILFATLMIMAIFGFALIPFRAVLLLEHTFLYTWLSGSSLSVLILAAQNPDRPVFLGFVVLVAALSMVKFLPLYYWMGKKWGPEFITMSFGGHPPRWFRKLEGFIYRRIDVSLFASYIPFSPIPATIVVAIGGIAKVKGWLVGIYVVVFATMLKCFYLYLGLRFGEGIQSSLETIDKYVMRITLALIAWMFISIWWKNKKKAQ